MRIGLWDRASERTDTIERRWKIIWKVFPFTPYQQPPPHLVLESWGERGRKSKYFPDTKKYQNNFTYNNKMMENEWKKNIFFLEKITQDMTLLNNIWIKLFFISHSVLLFFLFFRLCVSPRLLLYWEKFFIPFFIFLLLLISYQFWNISFHFVFPCFRVFPLFPALCGCRCVYVWFGLKKKIGKYRFTNSIPTNLLPIPYR